MIRSKCGILKDLKITLKQMETLIERKKYHIARINKYLSQQHRKLKKDIELYKHYKRTIKDKIKKGR